MRTIAAAARSKIYAQEMSGAFPVLLEITHYVAGYDSPTRIVNNHEQLFYTDERGGFYYEPFPFRFDPPDLREDGGISNARLTICAIDQQLAYILRSTAYAPTVRAIATFWNYDGSHLVFEPVASWEFTVRNVSGNAETITAELVYETRLGLEAPGCSFRPSLFPGIF